MTTPHISFITGVQGTIQLDIPLPTVHSAINIDTKLIHISPSLKIGVYGICHGLESVQSLISYRDGWTLTLAGKIYNLSELKARVSQHGFKAKTLTEAEIFLILYLHDKEWLLLNINAKYCAAISSKTSLILIRDKIGEEQIYYSISDSVIAFSSEIKAISQLLGHKGLQFTEEFKLFETPLGNKTIHKGIYKLESGTELTIDLATRETKKHTYWQIQPSNYIRTGKEYIEEFLYLINDAISIRLQQDKQTSAYLSGGQDSSFICCTLDMMDAKPAHVYTTAWASLDSVYNEAPWASIVAKSIDVQHIVLEPDAKAFRQHFPQTLWILDEAKANAAHFTEYWIAKEAFNRGDKNLFSGYGADEILGGEIRYLVMYLDRNRKETSPLFDTHPLLKNYKPLMQKLHELPEDTNEAQKYYHLIKRGKVPQETDVFYQDIIYKAFSKFSKLIDQMGYVDILISGPPLLDSNRLNKYWGIDKVCPFLDYRVVNFAFSVPEELKVNGFTTKHILRLASKGIVPDIITNRPDKVGFAFPHNDKQYVGFLHELANELKQRLGENTPLKSDKSRGRFDRTTLMLASQEILHQFYTDKNYTFVHKEVI